MNAQFLSRLMWRSQTPQKVRKNLDSDVKVGNLQSLKERVSNENGYFTGIGLISAWEQRDLEKMDFIRGKMEGRINTNFMVDVSLEEGDDKMTRHLISNYGAQPSLYAKQMAEINGHTKLAKLVETFYPLRNNVSIAHVHRRMDGKGRTTWADCVPEQYRFILT